MSDPESGDTTMDQLAQETDVKVDAAWDKFTDAWASDKNSMADKLGSVGTLMSDMSKVVGETGAGIGEVAEDAARGRFGDGIVGETAEAVAGVAGETAEAGLEIVGEIVEMGGEIAGTATKAVGEVLGKAFDAGTALREGDIDKALELGVEAGIAIAGGVVKVGGEVIEGVVEVGAELIEGTVEVAGEAIEGAAEVVGEVGGAIVDGISDFFSSDGPSFFEQQIEELKRREAAGE
ncbi:MAG TPA: hypothetical protein VGQ89_01700 [Candidatus Limnocylindrales bacterium]|nr:hypothetical protein [Candidatus Limnocylindrales bacterium]